MKRTVVAVTEQKAQVILTGERTVQEWANEISQAFRTGIEAGVSAAIETGKWLIESAKGLKKHKGEWERMFEEKMLPFSLATAEQFMRIARKQILAKSDHGQILPQSWRTLYELSRIPDDRLLTAINDGEVTPEMQRKP